MAMIVQLPTLLSRCWFSLDGTIHCIITTLAISMSNLDGADFTFIFYYAASLAAGISDDHNT